ncbi:MAG: hypothetical protein HRT38_15480 [Alteromonadaceae bacterium]|nr:hypothetical protein [Alteromonadaceae bacterium]
MINTNSTLVENIKSKADTKRNNIFWHNKDVFLAVNNEHRWFNSNANFNISVNPKNKEIISNLTKPTKAAFEFSGKSRPLTGV